MMPLLTSQIIALYICAVFQSFYFSVNLTKEGLMKNGLQFKKLIQKEKCFEEWKHKEMQNKLAKYTSINIYFKILK
jgi:hypothetical protein